jgi:hypothetical protein
MEDPELFANLTTEQWEALDGQLNKTVSVTYLRAVAQQAIRERNAFAVLLQEVAKHEVAHGCLDLRMKSAEVLGQKGVTDGN